MSGYITGPDGTTEFADFKSNNSMTNSLYDGYGTGFDADYAQDGYVIPGHRSRFQPKKPDIPVIFPQLYKRSSQRTRHNSADETNYAKWNLSQHTSIIENPAFSYVNTPLHAMYFLKPLRNMFLNHLCEDEHCITCQIGFLYRMLHDQQLDSPVANSNLIRSLKIYAEISAISIIREARGYGYFVKELQAYLKFIFKQIKKELPRRFLKDPDPEVAWISKIMGANYSTTTRCTSCGSKEVVQDEMFTLTLDYTKITPDVAGVPFTHVLEQNYNQYNKQMEKCKKCMRMAYAESSREYFQLPPVLAVDINLTSPQAGEFWLTQNRIYDTRPEGSLNEFDARFVVQAKPSKPKPNPANNSNGRGSPETNPLIIGSKDRSSGANKVETQPPPTQTSTYGHAYGKWGHYLPSRISVKEENGRWTFSESSGPGTINYMLYACVMGICEGENHFSHFITVVKDSQPKEPFKNWIVFNDHIVTPVTENEALFTDLNWKWPVLLFYVNPLHDMFKANEETKRIPIPVEVFDACKNLASHAKSVPKPGVPLNELPKSGDIVGLDAEFIHISECRTLRSVGRVSCVTEDKVILDDFIIMPESDVVHDYITEYSGIVESDLDPHKSTKYLTTLKSTYMKLLYLVENKVIFVGHALNNDFRMLNIHVPPTQVQDTVQLFSLPNYKLLSLQFLAREILREDIQQKTHDSIEDARMALKLHRKYQQMKGGSDFVNIMLKLYETWSSQRSSPVTAAIRYQK